MYYLKSLEKKAVHITSQYDIWTTLPTVCGNRINQWEAVPGPATCKNCIRIVKAEAKKYGEKQWLLK